MKFLREAMESFREQWAMMKLTAAVAACATSGHLEGVVIEFKHRLQRVCPRCGRELE